MHVCQIKTTTHLPNFVFLIGGLGLSSRSPCLQFRRRPPLFMAHMISVEVTSGHFIYTVW